MADFLSQEEIDALLDIVDDYKEIQGPLKEFIDKTNSLGYGAVTFQIPSDIESFKEYIDNFQGLIDDYKKFQKKLPKLIENLEKLKEAKKHYPQYFI